MGGSEGAAQSGAGGLDQSCMTEGKEEDPPRRPGLLASANRFIRCKFGTSCKVIIVTSEPLEGLVPVALTAQGCSVTP